MTSLPVGPTWTAPARQHVADTLNTGVQDGVLSAALVPLGGGMENALAPYLVLAVTGNDQRFLLLERRNDDGEFQPLFYRAPAECDGLDADSAPIARAMVRIGEYAEELRLGDLVAAGIVPASDIDPFDTSLEEVLSDLLYGFRDVISPNALDI